MRSPVLLLLAIVLVARGLASPAFETWRLGPESDAKPSSGSIRPGVLLAGGGGDIDEAFLWFRDLCGGGDVVVLRASGGDGYQEYLFKEIGGFASVTTLLLNEASAARDPEVLRLLGGAEGVFIAGGDQARYIRDWVGTPLQAVLQAHVDEGKPIGGTSAGLAVLGGWSFHALGDTITSPEALENPRDTRITIGRGLVIHPLLSSVLTDSHFSERERMGRLCAFLSTAHQIGARSVRGLGIDEATAVCLDGRTGLGKVVSRKSGQAWVVSFETNAGPGEGALQGRGFAVAVPAGSTLRFPTLESESGRGFAIGASAGQLALRPEDQSLPQR